MFDIDFRAQYPGTLNRNEKKGKKNFKICIRNRVTIGCSFSCGQMATREKISHRDRLAT